MALRYQQAVKQAQANANTFKRPYRVFCDTSGNWRCERFDIVNASHSTEPAEIYNPTLTIERENDF